MENDLFYLVYKVLLFTLSCLNNDLKPHPLTSKPVPIHSYGPKICMLVSLKCTVIGNVI